MAERNAVKPRQCQQCKQSYQVTAKAIAQHAASCKGEQG